MATSNSKSPRRNSLPSSISISHDEHPKMKNSNINNNKNDMTMLMRRRSSMKELSTSTSNEQQKQQQQQQQQHSHSGAPWCSLLPPKVPLTKHQQTLVQQACRATAIDNNNNNNNKSSILALVGSHGSGKSLLARHLVDQQQQQQQQQQQHCLWLHADTEWTLRASYIAVLRQYAPCTETTSLLLGQQQQQPTQPTTLQLAHQIATLVLSKTNVETSSSSSSSWTVVYDNVGVPAEQFFAQWSIPTTCSTTTTTTTIVTTCLIQNYQQWQQDKYQALVVNPLPEADAMELVLNHSEQQQQVDDDEEEEKKEHDTTTTTTTTSKEDTEALQTLTHKLLHGLPLALRMARAQWHQLEVTLPTYVEELIQYKNDYCNDNNNQQQQNNGEQNNDDKAAAADNLDWFWSFAIHHVWELSYNQEDYHHALIVASLLHRDYIPSAIFQPWSIVLMQLQAWHILQPSTSNSSTTSTATTNTTTYFSIPTCLQQAIRRRVPMNALGTAVEAVQTAFHTVLPDPIAFLPHLETLQANVELLQEAMGGQLPADFPRDDYAQVLLQTGLLLQRPPLADYPRAQKYFSNALGMVLPLPPATNSNNNNDDGGGSSIRVQATTTTTAAAAAPTTNRKAHLAKQLKYRLASIARLQGQQEQALQYSLEALQLYGYKKLLNNHNNNKNKSDNDRHNDEERAIQPLPKDMRQEDWNMLSQLFHICGQASWKLRDVMDAKFYFQHELKVKQAWFGPDTPQERLARTLNNLGSVSRECGDLPQARDYCVQSLEMQRALHKPDNLEMATTLNNLGALSYSLCDYTQAQQYFTQALDMKRQCYGAQEEQEGVGVGGSSAQNQDIAETLHNLGMLADHLGDYETARRYYLESLECKYAVYGKDAPNADLATTLTSLGLLTMNHGQYQESQEYYQRALDMQRAVYKDDGNMEIVRTLHGLGILKYHLGKIQESRQFHKEALKMQQAMEQADQSKATKTYLADPRTANLSQIMQNLGNLSHNVGEYDEARGFYEQSLQLYSQVCANKAKDDQLQRMLGNLQNLSSTTSYNAARTFYEKSLEMKYFVYGKDAKNSDLAFTLHSLALLDDNVGRYKEAQQCYEDALKMLHHLYGGKTAQNGEIAGILHGLGTVAFNRGNYADSERYFQESLKMKETVYGGRDAINDDLATTHVSLGTLAHSVGKYDDAKLHLERALEMQQKVYGDMGEDDPNIEVAVTCNSLANLYRDLGQYDKALSFYEESAKRMGEDSDNPFLASLLTDFGELYRLKGDYEKSNECLMRATELQQILYGEEAENAESAFTLTTLGKLYSSQGKNDEAQGCLDRALKMQRSVFRNDEGETTAHGEVAETLEALGNLALARGDLESSRKFLEEAEMMREKVQGKDANTVEKLRNLRSLGDVEAALGDDEAAQKHRDDSESMHDSITELVSNVVAADEEQENNQDDDANAQEDAAAEPEIRTMASTEKELSSNTISAVEAGLSIEEPVANSAEDAEDAQATQSGKDVVHLADGSVSKGFSTQEEESEAEPFLPPVASNDAIKEFEEIASAVDRSDRLAPVEGGANAVNDETSDTNSSYGRSEREAEDQGALDGKESDPEETKIEIETKVAIPPKSEKAAKKAAEKWKKNVKERKDKEKETSKRQQSKESKSKGRDKGNKPTKEKSKKSLKKNEKEMDEGRKKEKSKKSLKKNKEEEDDGQENQVKAVSSSKKQDASSTVEAALMSMKGLRETKESKEGIETAHLEQTTGEGSDEAGSGSKKKKRKNEKSREGIAATDQEIPVTTSDAEGNVSTCRKLADSEVVEKETSWEESKATDTEISDTTSDAKLQPTSVSRSRNLPDFEVYGADKAANASGVGPVTDMPPRYPQQSAQTTCGCWPFFVRR